VRQRHERETISMPSNLETTLHRLNEVIALAQEGGYHTATFLLHMASLDLRLQAACITEEEFRALVDDLQSRVMCNKNDTKPTKFAKATS
jgi:hypothetical protein